MQVARFIAGSAEQDLECKPPAGSFLAVITQVQWWKAELYDCCQCWKVYHVSTGTLASVEVRNTSEHKSNYKKDHKDIDRLVSDVDQLNILGALGLVELRRDILTKPET